MPVPSVRPVRGLSLLHALDATLNDGEVVGRLEIVYGDGKTRTVDVVSGEDVGSRQGLHDLRNAKPAVKTWNIVRFDGLYASHFPLKEPGPVSITLNPLKGKWLGCRECHIGGPKSSWILIYQRFAEKLLIYLVRTGSHTDLKVGEN